MPPNRSRDRARSLPPRVRTHVEEAHVRDHDRVHEVPEVHEEALGDRRRKAQQMGLPSIIMCYRARTKLCPCVEYIYISKMVLLDWDDLTMILSGNSRDYTPLNGIPSGPLSQFKLWKSSKNDALFWI